MFWLGLICFGFCFFSAQDSPFLAVTFQIENWNTAFDRHGLLSVSGSLSVHSNSDGSNAVHTGWKAKCGHQGANGIPRQEGRGRSLGNFSVEGPWVSELGRPLPSDQRPVSVASSLQFKADDPIWE